MAGRLIGKIIQMGERDVKMLFKIVSLIERIERFMQKDKVQEILLRVLFVDFLFFVLYGGWVIVSLFSSEWVENRIDFFFWLSWVHFAIWGCCWLNEMEPKGGKKQ